ncbi:hypothetical protein B0H17DRAFT_1055204 [Mycena rosella]|uniref:Uncharacterized protein n=1 Tax=Mycena rosella TaxID=1033263 RepID=A0AAD7DN11_MYCRO|nr:hypothetical protein B0H17DRAFT_1055204 [Mycena rosella]
MTPHGLPPQTPNPNQRRSGLEPERKRNNRTRSREHPEDASLRQPGINVTRRVNACAQANAPDGWTDTGRNEIFAVAA